MATPTFSAEEILYTRRFEEGYDLPDLKYMAWLSINHPTADTVNNNMAPLPIVGLHVTTPSTPVSGTSISATSSLSVEA